MTQHDLRLLIDAHISTNLLKQRRPACEGPTVLKVALASCQD